MASPKFISMKKGSIFLGNNIKNKRKDFDLSQEQLAEEIGTVGSTISHIETAKFMPTLVCAIRFSQVFNCTIDELVIEPKELKPCPCSCGSTDIIIFTEIRCQQCGEDATGDTKEEALQEWDKK